ncbi:aldehyde dehydrogenase family protein, partial [Cupriavidus taiwanensis]|uniref:aldehyde dehydrogenase family protein n=1 Tax=Cupriavidus taiwanensis TaxID=164546 RepID=UPI000E2F43FD
MSIAENRQLAEVHHFIGGTVRRAGGQRQADVYNPATGEVSARVALGTAQDVADAVAAAKAAFPAWADTPPLRRARILFKFKELLDQHHDDLAALITREHGKVFSDAKGE